MPHPDRFFLAMPPITDARGVRCVAFIVTSDLAPEMVAMSLGTIPSYVISDFSCFPIGATGFVGAVFPEDYPLVQKALTDMDMVESTKPNILEQIRNMEQSPRLCEKPDLND
jgi:hypothetical protein